MFVFESNVFWMSRAFSVNFYGDCFSFGLGFVERSHKPLICLDYESKTSIDVKETWNHQIT